MSQHKERNKYESVEGGCGPKCVLEPTPLRAPGGVLCLGSEGARHVTPHHARELARDRKAESAFGVFAIGYLMRPIGGVVKFVWPFKSRPVAGPRELRAPHESKVEDFAHSLGSHS